MQTRLLILLLFFFIVSVKVSANFTSLKDSIAQPQDTIKLDEITISATTQSKISGMLSGNLKLNVEDLQATPSLTGTVDVLKLMELTPSVRTSGDGNSNMYVRGGDSGQNLILYNDASVYSPGHILGIFPLFNANHLSWVKMIKNGAETEAGNFLSSVIEISTKDELPNKFEAKGNVGLLASQITLAVPISNTWGAYVSGRKTYLELIAQPLINNLFTSSDANDSSLKYDFWDSNLTVLGKLNSRHSLQIDVMMGGDNLRIDDQEIMIDGKLKWQSIVSSVALESTLSDDLLLNQSVSYTHFDNKLNTKQGEMHVNLKSKIEDISYKNKLTFWFDNINLSTGINYTYHYIDPHSLQLSNAEVITNSIVEDKLEAHDFAPYLGFEWRVNNRLMLRSTLRYNVFSAKTLSQNNFTTHQALDARASVQYKLRGNVFLKAHYNHNNQFVNKLTPSSVGLPTDFWIVATDKLKPQHGDEFSVGYYHLLPTLGMEFSADVYYRTMNNVTQFDYNFIENDNISFVEKISYGTGRAYGLEMMVKRNFDKLTGWLSYTLSKSDRKFDIFNSGKRFAARYDRTHDFSATANYKFNSKWDVSLTGIYATGNRYTQPTSWYFINNLPVKEYTSHNNAQMPAYKRVDVGVNYWFKKDNGLNLSVYNMFASQNPIYVFMNIKESPWTENQIYMEMKRKYLYTIIPSLSWNFKF